MASSLRYTCVSLARNTEDGLSGSDDTNALSSVAYKTVV